MWYKKKIGAYGIIRYNILWLNEIDKYNSPIIIILGIISVLYSIQIVLRVITPYSMMGVLRKTIDLKQIIAYSSIIHMNVYLIGLYTKNNKGITLPYGG